MASLSWERALDFCRQFNDEQIRALIDRGAVFGAAFDAWMLKPGWVRGQTRPETAGVTLSTVAEHIDHICQLAGNVRHVGIGSDLDGAFGTEQTPADLHSNADLQGLIERLRERGYSDGGLENIAGGNFLRFLRGSWVARAT